MTVKIMDGMDKLLMTTFIHVFGFSKVKCKTAFANAGIKSAGKYLRWARSDQPEQNVANG